MPTKCQTSVHRAPLCGDSILGVSPGSPSGHVEEVFGSGRLTMRTLEGRATSIVMQRLRWCPTERAWLCYSMAAMRLLEGAPAATVRARYPSVGDVIHLDGWLFAAQGWVVRTMPDEASGTPVRAFQVSTTKGYMTILRELVSYCPVRKGWVAALAAALEFISQQEPQTVDH